MYLVICIFLCWEWGRWVVYLVSVYLVFILVWEVIDYILGLCTQKYLEFSGL